MAEVEREAIRLTQGSMEAMIHPGRGALISSLMWAGRECLHRLPENIASSERPRCGIPVMFPYYGNPGGGVLKLKGREYPAGLHGFLHSFPWTVEDLKVNQAILRMDSDEELAGRYPYAFHARMTITLTDEGLISTVEITNDSSEVMPCDLGMHPFFLIEDYDALTLVAHPERMEDAATGIPLDHLKKASVLAQGCFLSHCPMIAVEDPLRNQRMELRLEKGYRNLMVWSGDAHRFLVLEPLTGPLDGINQKQAGLNLAPRASAKMTWSLRLSRLKPEPAADCPKGTK